MNYFQVVTKFFPQAVDKYFAEDSKSVILENGAKFIDVNFNETGYVKIADFLLDGLSDYYKTQEMPRPDDPAGYAAYAGNLGSGERDGFDIGGTTVRWEIFKLQWCRGRQFRIDHISNEETGKIVTGGIVEEFHRLKVIPEVDACRFGAIADEASFSLGNMIQEVIGTDITESNNSTGIIHRFNAAIEWLSIRGVPKDDCVIFVRPEIMTMIRNTPELTKFLTQTDYKNANGLDFTVEKYHQWPIIEVTPDRFYTEVKVTRNGYMPSSTSRSINYMICNKKCVVPIRKIEHQKLYGEEQAGIAGFYGTMMNYLLYHGIIIPRNKLVGVYVSVGAAESGVTASNLLFIDTRAGSAANSWRLKAYYTLPAGLRGTVVWSTSAFTLGDQVYSGGSWDDGVTPVELDEETVDAVNTAVYFGLVDGRGVVIARTTSAVTLVKKSA